MKELRELDFCWMEGRKEGGRKENLQTDEILCHCCLYKFPESREIFGFPLLAQLGKLDRISMSPTAYMSALVFLQ